LVSLVLAIVLIPQVTFAAWWNPFSWFTKPITPPKVLQVSTTTSATKSAVATTTPKATKEKPIVKVVTSAPVSKPVAVKPEVILPTKLTNAEIIKKVKPAVVYVETKEGSGSGMIISSDGYIITNAHVVKGATDVKVSLPNESPMDGVVVGRDENVDLALVKINPENGILNEIPNPVGKTGKPIMTPVAFGNSDTLAQGDNVFALGYPFGIKGDASFTAGVVSRLLTASSTKYIEMSVEIHPGNSGGPLVDQYGQVVGINTATFGNVIGGIQVGETIKLAIPINTASIIISKLKSGLSIVKSKSEVGFGEVSYSCPLVIAETKKVVGTWVQLFTEYKDISKFIETSEKGPDGLTGLDALKKIYENLSNQRYTLDDKVQQMGDDSVAASSLNLQYGDSNYLLQLGKLFNDTSITLKKYFDARLDTFSWVISNRSWDDYLIEQFKKKDESDYLILKTAYGSVVQTATPFTNLMLGYKKILTQNKCADAVTDNGTLLIGMFDETSCKSLLGELATYKNQEYTCACGFGTKIYEGRCELYTTICGLKQAYADQQGGCHCYPGTTLKGASCVN